MKNKRILITGGGGSIGSELVRQLAKDNAIFIIDNNETACFDLIEEMRHLGYDVHGRVGDIRNRDTVEDAFSDFKPQVVFHAAALKHVTMGEWYPREYAETNIMGTLNIIEYAKKWECLEKFVFISTDKAVQSASIMGATKRVGEIITRNQGRGFVVVRFGNVLGSRGSVIPLWQAALEKGEKLKVTHPEMTRYMMSINDAAGLVIQAAEQGEGGEIFILDMGEPVRVLDLALDILKKAGKKPEVDIIGLRPGEQLQEKMMFEEEERDSIYDGKFIIIKK
jgi:FlaA1/EpsC-like NDP-sugar epimerase